MEWIQRPKEEVQQFWKTHGERVFLSLSFLLVGVFAFEAGLLQKSLGESQPVIIRVADSTSSSQNALHGEKNALPKETSGATKETVVSSSDCQFVGSRNSNKYHNPASRCAKQIKPENKRCFASVEAAQKAGYLPGCLTP